MKIKVEQVQFHREPESALVGYCQLVIDDWLVVKNVKLCRRPDGSRFVAMPNRFGKDGKWHDDVFPLNKTGRAFIEGAVFRVFDEVARLGYVESA